MNILLYSLIFAPDVCSNAYVFSDMAKELQRQGHCVTVITTTPHYDEATSQAKRDALELGKKAWYRKSVFEGMRVYHIDVAPKKGGVKQRIQTFSRFHKYAPKLIREEEIRADVVITQTPPPITVAHVCHKMAKMLGAKSVLILQDLWVDSMVKKGKIKGPAKAILSWIEKKEYNKMDAISTISQVMANKVMPKIKDCKKLHVIPNFVDTSLYHPLSVTAEMRQRYGVEEDDFVVSYVGNIGNAQDLSPLINYVKENPEKKIKVLVAGNGGKEAYYREMAKDVENITFLGFVPREETLLINAVSDVCMVMLAKHVTETSFPSKTYTIMAMGKPILITCGQNSAAGDFIVDNRLGWSIRTDDPLAMTEIMNHLSTKPKELKEYGDNALVMIEKEYSEAVVVGQYIALVESLK